MDDETTQPQPLATEETLDVSEETLDVPEVVDEALQEADPETGGAGADDDQTQVAVEEEEQPPVEEQGDSEIVAEDDTDAPPVEDISTLEAGPEVEEQQDPSADEPLPTSEAEPEMDEQHAEHDDALNDTHDADEDAGAHDAETQEVDAGGVDETPDEHYDEEVVDHEYSQLEPEEGSGEQAEDQAQEEAQEDMPEDVSLLPEDTDEQTHADAPAEALDHDIQGEDAETPSRMGTPEFESDEKTQTLLQMGFTPRKASLRTEALIQAAARAVVAKIEERKNNPDSIEEDDKEIERSISRAAADKVDEANASSDDHESNTRRESMESQIHHRVHSRSDSLDDGGDSSSHHDVDDDIFTDHSSRNSLSSLDDPNDVATKSVPYESQERRQSFLSNGGESPRGRSPRVSGVSIISGLSQYDKEDFVPTSRDKRRIPFRTPSAVRAMQMSSPTPSVYGGASPRSGKRRSGTPGNGLPTISRLGSPTVSTQYSPKGRSTPPRFKSRKEAPLVLLHVTLLPLQWMWGHVMNSLDVVHGKALDERGEIYNAPEQLKTLRDAWRELQDRVGDTVLERGVLLPHPQNDYEVLEERLLEALELPLRRRARILECGHYLGPANVMAEDEEESEDEYAGSGRAKEEKKHWCNTCRGEIKYEDLGPGKVFRVKVYASNGLMKAGAWEACWKEMERVDIEVEPIVDPSLQSELEELAVVVELDQEDRMRREEEAAALEAEREQEQEQVRESIEKDEPAAQEFAREASLPVRQEEAYTNAPEQHPRSSLMSSPPPSALQLAMHASPLQPLPSSALRALSPALAEPMDMSDERRRRDEERMREIYGEAPPPLRLEHEAVPLHTEPAASRAPPPEHAYMPPPQTPQSPSEQVYERRQRRESPRRRNLDDAGFVELFCEAIKVLLRDSKNVAIIVLCIFLMCMLMRPTSHPPAFAHDPVPYRYNPKPEVSMNTQTAVTEASSSQATSQAPVLQPVSEAQAPIVEEVMDVPSIVAEVLSSHTPETSMVVEEPETSVPEPTAEAVEEAPSSVVELSPSESPETPAVEDAEVSDVSEASEAAEPGSEDIDSAVVEPEVLASEASDDVSSEDHISGFSEPVVEVLDAEVPEDGNSDVQSLAEEEIVDTPLFDEAAAEITPDGEALEVHEASDFFEPTAQEPFDVLVEVEETLPQEASDDAPLEECQSEPVEPAAEVIEEPLNSVEIESEETPDAAAVEEEDATTAPEPELTETVMEEVVTEEADLNATILEEVPLDEPTLDDVVKEPPQIVMDTPEIEEPLAATPSTDTSDEAPAAEATHSCESYLQSAKSASFAITQTPAQPTAWPESPVTEWKTVKVFETVTETVRISVTATGIVSTIPTVETIRAPPATVEETVYETETIRVTVTESAEAEATGVGHDEL